MIRVILGDNEAIFRAGMARVLVRDEGLRIVAQCAEETRLLDAVKSFRSSVILVGRSMCKNLPLLFSTVEEAGSRIILILDNGKQPQPEMVEHLFGVIHRNVEGQALIECVRRVARGEKMLAQVQAGVREVQHESVGTRIRQRLTPREMQVVGLIVKGCRNKDIASQLGTKEQVVKNYLRSVYGKVGVSDRLELALFAIHHRVVDQQAMAR